MVSPGEHINYKTDLYSVGIILYTMLYGYGPYNVTTNLGLKEIKSMVQKGMIIGEDYRAIKFDRITLDFLKLILKKDQTERPHLDDLFEHKFILNNKLDKSKMNKFSYIILNS